MYCVSLIMFNIKEVTTSTKRKGNWDFFGSFFSVGPSEELGWHKKTCVLMHTSESTVVYHLSFLL